MKLRVWFAALLWHLGQADAVARSRSPVARQVPAAQQLRGVVAVPQPVTLSSSVDEPAAARAGKGGKGDKDKRKADKKPDRDWKDTKGDEGENLQDEIVDQATTAPCRKEFDNVDRNGNEKIDLWEYLASTRAESRVATYRFNCSDANLDHSLDLKEFNAAQENPKDMERCVSMLFAFRMVDKDQNGEISQSELWSNVGGPNFDARWAFTIACSDLNGDGKISPMEFSQDMYGCQEEKADQALEAFMNFTLTDTNGDGRANETELAVAVNRLFGIDLISKKSPGRATRRLSRRWMSCVDFDASHSLSEKEYTNGLLAPTPEQAECTGNYYTKYEADMDFEIMDTSNDGRISRQEYYDWCSKLDITIHQQEAAALFASADVNEDGFIDDNEFNSAGEEHEGDGEGHLFFLRSTDPVRSRKSHTAWLGTLQKTWAGLLKLKSPA